MWIFGQIWISRVESAQKLAPRLALFSDVCLGGPNNITTVDVTFALLFGMSLLLSAADQKGNYCVQIHSKRFVYLQNVLKALHFMCI